MVFRQGLQARIRKEFCDGYDYGGSTISGVMTVVNMEIQAHYLTPPHTCSYLPKQIALLEYLSCRTLTLSEYGLLLEQGWRRFGRSVFRPRCPFCTACWSLRVVVDEFK